MHSQRRSLGRRLACALGRDFERRELSPGNRLDVATKPAKPAGPVDGDLLRSASALPSALQPTPIGWRILPSRSGAMVTDQCWCRHGPPRRQLLGNFFQQNTATGYDRPRHDKRENSRRVSEMLVDREGERERNTTKVQLLNQRTGVIRSRAILGGLHHHYARV